MMDQDRPFWELGLNPVTMKKPERYITGYDGIREVREPYPGENRKIRGL